MRCGFQSRISDFSEPSATVNGTFSSPEPPPAPGTLKYTSDIQPGAASKMPPHVVVLLPPDILYRFGVKVIQMIGLSTVQLRFSLGSRCRLDSPDEHEAVSWSAEGRRKAACALARNSRPVLGELRVNNYTCCCSVPVSIVVPHSRIQSMLHRCVFRPAGQCLSQRQWLTSRGVGLFFSH